MAVELDDTGHDGTPGLLPRRKQPSMNQQMIETQRRRVPVLSPERAMHMPLIGGRVREHIIRLGRRRDRREVTPEATPRQVNKVP
jgi:hypothetical protein